MTVRAIYNIKMNSFILVPAATVGSLSHLMQMKQITVCSAYLKAVLGQNRQKAEQGKSEEATPALYFCVIMHLVDFGLSS